MVPHRIFKGSPERQRTFMCTGSLLSHHTPSVEKVKVCHLYVTCASGLRNKAPRLFWSSSSYPVLCVPVWSVVERSLSGPRTQTLPRDSKISPAQRRRRNRMMVSRAPIIHTSKTSLNGLLLIVLNVYRRAGVLHQLAAVGEGYEIISAWHEFEKNTSLASFIMSHLKFLKLCERKASACWPLCSRFHPYSPRCFCLCFSDSECRRFCRRVSSDPPSDKQRLRVRKQHSSLRPLSYVVFFFVENLDAKCMLVKFLYWSCENKWIT